MVLDNSVLDLIRKIIASSKSDDDSADQTSIVKDVTQNIKLLLKVTPLLSPREIIQYIDEHHIEYRSRQYFGHVLVLDYNVNPFEIYAIVSAEDLWDINQYFGSTFSVCQHTPYPQIKDTLKHLSSLENVSTSSGSFISNIASYYQTHLDEYDDLMCDYMSSPTEFLEGLCDYGLDYLMKTNHSKGLNYIQQLQDSDSLVMNNLATHMLIHVVEHHLSIAANHVRKAVNQLQTIDYSADTNQPFIRNCQALLIATYRNACIEEDREEIQKLIYDTAYRSDEAHYVLSHEVALDIHSSDSGIHLNVADYLDFIAQIKTLQNPAIIDNIDLVLSWALTQLPAEKVWPSFIAIGTQNECSGLERLDSTTFEIAKNISKYLPFIYGNILSSTSMKTVGIKLLQDFSFHDRDDYAAIDWSSHIPSEEKLIIANKVFLSCIHPKFLIQWGILFAHDLNEESASQYCSLYTSLVCENYLYTAIEEIPSLLLHNSVQISLQKTATEYCQKRISELKAVRQFPDFSPSHDRQRLYQIEQYKQTKESQKKSESKSVFANLFSTVHMKYGVRSAHLLHDGDNAFLEERNYMTISMELELPYTAIYDPQTYYFNICQVFEEDNAE